MRSELNMVSQQIVEQWRVRLAAWQQRLDEGRPRPWLARAYVRVLSYLLAQYAPQADPIVVAAFYRPLLASGLQTMRAVEGIESKSKRFRRQTQVIVRAGDLERAQPIVASHRAVARDSPRYRREYSGAFLLSVLIVGALIGTIIGSAVAIAVNWSPFALLGFVLGVFFGFLVWAIVVALFDPASC